MVMARRSVHLTTNKHVICSGQFIIGPVKQKKVSIKVWLFSYPSVYTCVLGAQKNPSYWDSSFEYTHHMFWLRSKKIIFSHTFISGGLIYKQNKRHSLLVWARELPNFYLFNIYEDYKLHAHASSACKSFKTSGPFLKSGLPLKQIFCCSLISQGTNYFPLLSQDAK